MKEYKKYRANSLRLQSWDYSWNGTYFVTICVKHHKYYLGRIDEGGFEPSKFGRIVKKYWLEIPQKNEFVFLDKFTIMPNHIHGIIIINRPENQFQPTGGGNYQSIEKIQNRNPLSVKTIHELSLRNVKYRRKMLLPRIIGRFKMQSAKQINSLRNANRSFWQKNYYEHIIRNENDLMTIRKYIINNHLKWALDKYNLHE